MNSFRLFFIILLILADLNLCSQTIIKFSTLAPEGTSWTKVLRQWAKEIEEKSKGKIKFKIYSGGVSGDEKDMVRKIRIGQLHAAGFTGVGIGEIAPEIRVLDAPFLFEVSSEIDYIYQKFDKDFRKIFEEKGFVLLGWSEVGQVYIFSKEQIKTISELGKVKMWIWEGDPIAQITFQELGIKPIPLSISDVMTSLQTGMINSVYGTPGTIIPLQWYNTMKYVIDMPITNASGAVLISKRIFDSLSKEEQKIILELSEKYFKDLNLISRNDNQESIKILKSKGLLFLKPNDEEKRKFLEAAYRARQKLADRVYSKDLLLKIENELEKQRKNQKR